MESFSNWGSFSQMSGKCSVVCLATFKGIVQSSHSRPGAAVLRRACLQDGPGNLDFKRFRPLPKWRERLTVPELFMQSIQFCRTPAFFLGLQCRYTLGSLPPPPSIWAPGL